MTNAQILHRSLGWTLSSHARAACRRRGVAVRDVLLAVADYEQSYTCEHRGAGRQVRQRGPLAVVVDRDTNVVITVLLRQQDHWTDEEAALRFRGGAA